MSTYAQTDDLTPRIGGRSFNETSKPNVAEVAVWLDEAEAELLGTLESVGIASIYARSSRGFALLRGWVANYVAGRLRQAQAASGGDGQNNDGNAQITEWYKLLERIRETPELVSTMLSGTTTETSSDSLGFGSHITSPRLGLSPADYAPVYHIKGDEI